MTDDYTVRPDNKPAVSQTMFDNASVLNAPVVVSRDSKLLARKAVAGRAKDAKDCADLLDKLGLLDLDTLPEVPYE